MCVRACVNVCACACVRVHACACVCERVRVRARVGETSNIPKLKEAQPNE